MELLKEETLAKKLLTKGFWLYFFSFLIAPTGYLIRMIISNDLSVEEVWIIYWVMSFISIISTYHDLGLTESLQYFLPKYWINKEYDKLKTIISINFIIQLCTSLIIWALIFFWSDFLALHYFHNITAVTTLKYFSFYFLIINFFSLFNSFFTAFQDTFKAKLIEFTRYISVFFMAFILYNTWIWSLEKYSATRIIWIFIALLLAIGLYIKYYNHTLNKWKVSFNKTLIKEYIKYALMVFITLNIHYIFMNIDQQLIIYILGTKQSWYYSNYLSLLQIPWALIFPFFSVLFPITTELINKNQKDKLRLLINVLYKYFTIIIIFFWFLFMIFWKVIAIILFSEKFIISWEILQLTWIFYFIAALVQINFSTLAWMGKVNERMKIILIALIINIILNIIFILYFWIKWSAIAIIISNAIIFLLSFHHIKKEINPSFDFKFIIKNILFSWLLSFFIYEFLYKFFILKNEYRFHNFKLLMIISIIYFLILLIFNYKEVIKLKQQIKKLKNWE